MIDLSPCDSPPGAFPLRADDVGYPPERVLHIHLWTAEDPQTGLCNALEGLGGPSDIAQRCGAYVRVDWTRLDLKHKPNGGWSQFETAALDAAEAIKPTLVFMQLQTLGVVDAAFLVTLRGICDPNAVFISWCGDVGRDPMWSHCMAPYMDAMLFSSMTQVEEHRAAGFPNAAYLQIGYDTDIHFVDPEFDRQRNGQVLFFGQNYSDVGWVIPHEAQLRRDVIRTLWQGLPPVTLEVYGQNWSSVLGRGTQVFTREAAAHAYQNSCAAVSISLTSKLKRYSSDRLLRALACGLTVLVKRFDDMESWGLVHGENCWIWDTSSECLDGARWCRINHESARQIGAAGAQLAREHHTWGTRMREMFVYVDHIRMAKL